MNNPKDSIPGRGEDEQLAEAFMHSYYGMYTADALTDEKFADREMIVVDADLVAKAIAKLVSLTREQAVAEWLGSTAGHDMANHWRKEGAEGVREQAQQETRTQLVLFGAELGYCLANNYPVGEEHTPPSMIYEMMETKVDKWLDSNRPMTNEDSNKGGDSK